MIKAIFFDLFNTLIHYDPSPVEQQISVCRKYRIEVSDENLNRGFWAASEQLTKMNINDSISRRSSEEMALFWIEYEMLLLKEAGVEISQEQAGQLVADLKHVNKKLVMYADSLPALELLRPRGLHVGLISNLNHDIGVLGTDINLEPLFDTIIISKEVGFDKPHPQIFRTALERANVQAHEAIHVGDQYHSDVVGARAAGITPILIDRDDVFEQYSDCHRINKLTEIVDRL